MVFLLLAAASWNRWIEPYIDTGRELMVPWRMAQGERLYRDVHFQHGPLGPLLAAGIDRSLGRSLAARSALAALIALLHLVALDVLARRLLPRWRAALATSLAVATAVFLRPGGWLFPFSFDTAIAVAALTGALVLSDEARRASFDLPAGLCLAAALLSRPEMGVAGVLVLGLAARGQPRRLLRLALLPLGAAGLVYGAFSIGTPWDRLVADGWLMVIDPPAAFQNVYRAYAGLDRIPLRSAELALSAVVLALIATLLCTAAFAAARLSAREPAAARTAGAVSIAILAAAAAIRFRPPVPLAQSLSLMPPLVRVVPPCLVAAAVLRLLLRLRGRQPRGPLSAVPDAALWLAALFSARMLLAAGYIGPYPAFFLPLPIVVCAVGLFALADSAAPAVGPALPHLTGAALSIFLLFRAASTIELYRRPGWERVSTPAGDLWLREPVAGTTRDALADLRERLPAGATLSGFPEVGFFNYALGLPNPFWLEQFFPGNLDAAGEERAVALLKSRPPDALLYANVLAVGEGQPVFGKDYLERLDAAARSRFRTQAIHGPGSRPGARIGDPDFFVEVLLKEGEAR